jgi:hypothetical protein
MRSGVATNLNYVSIGGAGFYTGFPARDAWKRLPTGRRFNSRNLSLAP